MIKHMACLLLGTGLLGGLACNSRTPVGVGVPTLAQANAAEADLEGPELFQEITSSSGIDFTYSNGEDVSPHLAILESLGGGVALIDFDGDGLMDVFLPGGGTFSGPEHKQIIGRPCKLFKNLGGLKFKDVTPEVGLNSLAGGQPWFYTHAAAVGDYDRDGWPDLLVTGWGRVALFHNESDGKGGRRFVDVSKAAGLEKGITWATSAAWADFDGDGYPDLYVCQYVDWSFTNHPQCNYDGKTPDVCPPKKFEGLPHKVYLNNANGTFTDVSDQAGLHKGGGSTSKGLGVLAIDVNLDGKPDVYVANDTVDNFLYVNQSSPGKIRFAEMGLLAGVARDGGGSPNGSMGLDACDPIGSGLPWLWVTNYENESHALYRNLCKQDHISFLFNTPASGIGAIGQKFVGWGTGFLDIDHDGWEDLFIVNGHAIRFPTETTRNQKPVLMRNQAGKFKEITPRGGAYFRKEHLSRGLGLVDLDNDGKIDAIVSHMNQPVAVLHNVAPSTASRERARPEERYYWLGVELMGQGNRDIVGARVILDSGGRKQTRFAKGGGSYASSPDRRHVFGLGMSDKIDKLTVIWPDGKEQEWTGLAVDRYHVLIQGDKVAREPKPRQ